MVFVLVAAVRFLCEGGRLDGVSVLVETLFARKTGGQSFARVFV